MSDIYLIGNFTYSCCPAVLRAAILSSLARSINGRTAEKDPKAGGSNVRASRSAYFMTSLVFAVESYAGSFRRVKVILSGNARVPITPIDCSLQAGCWCRIAM